VTNNKNAFILIEVLASLVIVASVIGVSMAIFTKLADMQRGDSDKRKALFAAKYKLEELRLLDYSNLDVGSHSESVDSVVNQPDYLPGGQVLYTVSERDLNGDGINDSKEIDVRVVW